MEGFSKELSGIYDEKYNNCYIGKVVYKKLKKDLDGFIYIISEEKSNRLLSIISIEKIKENKILEELKVILILKPTKKDNKIVSKDIIYSNNSQFFRKFSKREIYEFSKITGDKNNIHLTKEPVVQGLLILKELIGIFKEFNEVEIKFKMPIFANEKIYIQNKGNIIKGYVGNKNSFILTLKKEGKEDGSKE